MDLFVESVGVIEADFEIVDMWKIGQKIRTRLKIRMSCNGAKAIVRYDIHVDSLYYVGVKG